MHLSWPHFTLKKTHSNQKPLYDKATLQQNKLVMAKICSFKSRVVVVEILRIKRWENWSHILAVYLHTAWNSTCQSISKLDMHLSTYIHWLPFLFPILYLLESCFNQSLTHFALSYLCLFPKNNVVISPFATDSSWRCLPYTTFGNLELLLLNSFFSLHHLKIFHYRSILSLC